MEFTGLWSSVLLVACVIKINLIGAKSPTQPEKFKLATKFLKENTDWFFDKFISEYKQQLHNSEYSELFIGSLEKNAPANVLAMPLQGSFSAKHVILRDMSTLYRSEQANLTARCEGYLMGNDADITFELSTQLALHDFQITFAYLLNFLQLNAEGSALIKVKENSIYVQYSMILHPACAVKLEKLRVEEMSDVEVDVTGLSIAGPFVGALSSWLVEGLLNMRRSNIEAALFRELHKATENINLCHYLPI